ncbi:MAG: hypothetical protein HYY93_14610 [Planctomycetes bacterium]|nr:hypothetical protein [Planctomycetota bacterium]
MHPIRAIDRRLLAVLIFAALMGFSAPAGAETVYWSLAGSGNWGTAGNWRNDGPDNIINNADDGIGIGPAIGDTVILDHTFFVGAYTVTINANTVSVAGLTIGSGGNTITVGITLNRSLNVNSGAANLTIQPGGAVTASNGTITVSGNWTNNSGAGVDLTGGTVTFTGDGVITGPAVADPLVAGAVGDRFFNLTLAVATRITRLASHITCKNLLTVNGGMLDTSTPGAEYTLKLTRNGDGVDVTVGSAVNNIELFVDGPAVANVTLTGVTDNLHTVRARWPGGATLTLDFDMSCKKDFLIEAGTTVMGTTTTTARSHSIGNDFVCGRTGAATFVARQGAVAGTVSMTGSLDGVSEISGASDPSFFNLNAASPGKKTTLLRSVTVTNNFTVNGGQYDGAFSTTLTRESGNPIAVAVGSTITQGTLSFAPITGATAGYTISGINNTDQLNQLYELVISPVDAADVITLGQNLSLAGYLSVEMGAFAVGANTLTINGNTAVLGGRTLSASTGIIDANGLFSATGGNVAFTGTGKLYLSGDVTPDLGVFTRATSEVIYDNTAADQTVYNTNYWDLRVNNGGRTASIGFAVTTTSIDNSLTLSSASTLDCSGSFDQTGQTVTFGALGTGRLILRGTVASLGAFTAGNGTVQYTGDTSLTIPGVNYYNIEIGRIGAPGNLVTIQTISPTNLGNTLTITDDAPPSVMASVFGTTDATGRTITFGASGVGILRLDDSVTSLGTLMPGNGTIDYSQVTNFSVLAYNYYNLMFSGGGTATIGFAVNQTTLGNGATSGIQTLTLDVGTTLDVNAAFDLSGAGNRSVTFVGGETLNLSGSVGALVAGTGTFTAGTGTVIYDDTTAGQNIASVNYNNLVIDKGAGGTASARTATAAAALTDASLGGTLTVVGSSILTAAGGINVTAPRAVTCTGAGLINLTGGTTIDLGTFTAGTSRVRFANTSAGQTIPAEGGYYEIEVDNGGQTATIGWAVTDTEILAGGGIYITGSSVLDANTSFGGGAGFGSRIVSFGASGTGQLLLGGAVSSLGTLTVGNGTIVYDDAISGQTVVGTTYYNLVLSKGTGGAAARTATAVGAIIVSNNLTIAENGGLDTVLDLLTNNLTVAGTATVAGEISLATATVDLNGSFVATGGTVTITGAGTLELSGPVTDFDFFSAGAGSSTVLYNYTGGEETVEALTYRNLTLDPGAARTLTAEGDFTVDRVLTVSSGKFLVPAAVDFRVEGDGGAGNDLIVSFGATLELKGGATGSGVTMADTTIIAIGGTLLSNTGPSFPTVTSDMPGTTRFGFEILSGGLATIKGLTVTSPYTSANRGLHFNPGALTTGIDCDDITFNNPEGTGAFLNMELGAGGVSLSFTGHTYNGSPQYTVRTDSSWAGGQIYMSFFTNGGTATENDHDIGTDPNASPTSTIQWVLGTIWTGAIGTSWNDGGNWTGGIPTQDADVTIPDVANDPILDGAGGTCAAINISTGVLTINSSLPLNVYGDFINTGTLSMTAGTIVIRGDLPGISPGGSPFYNMEVNKFGSGNVTLLEDLVVINNLTVTSGPLNVGSNTLTVGTTGAGDVTLGAAGTLRIGTGRLDVKGAFDASSGGTVEFTGAGRLELAGTMPTGGLGAFTAGTGTVAYDGGGAQTVRTLGVTYNHLEIAKTGGSTATTSAAATLVLSGNLRLISGSLTAGAVMDLAGNLSIESGAGTFSAGAFPHTLAGHFTHDGGTFSAGAGTFTFDGGATQTIGGSASSTFNDIQIAGGSTVQVNPSGAATISAGGTFTVTGTLQIAAGRTLTANGAVAGSGAITFLAGSGALLDANADFNLTGALTFSGDATLRLDSTLTGLSSTPFTATTGTIVLGGGSAQTIPSNLFTYNHLTIDKSAASTATASALAILDVNGNLTVQNAGSLSAGNALDVEGALTMSSSGTFTLGAQNLNLAGNFLHSAGTFTVTTGLVTLDGAAQSFGGAVATSLASLTVSGTGTKSITAAVGVSTGATLTVNSTLAVTGATLTVDGSAVIPGTLEIQPAGLVDANGSFDASGGAVTFTSAGSLRLGGIVTSLGTFSGGSGTVRYDGSLTQSVRPVTYNNLEIALTAATGLVTGSFSVGGALTVTSGLFNVGGYTVTVSGAATVANGATLTIDSGALDAGGAFTANASGSVAFTSGGTLTLRGAVTSLGSFTSATGCTVVYRQPGAADQQVLVPAPSNYHHLTLDRSGQTSTAAGAFTLGGNLTITAGTLDLGSSGILVSGHISVPGVLRAIGGTIHADGTFDATGGAVNLSGGSAVLELDGPVTSLGTFTAGTSRVIYQDTGSAQTLRVAPYYDLRVNATGQIVTAATGGTIAVGGLLEVVAGTLSLPASSVMEVAGGATVTGVSTLSMAGNSTLRLATSLSIGTAVTSGGALATSSTGGTPAITTTDPVTPLRFALTVRNGGRVAVNGLNLSYTNGDGVHVMSDASTSCDIDNVTFSNIATAAVSYGYCSFLNMRQSSATAYSFSDCSFGTVNPAAAPPQYNVTSSGAGFTGTVELLSASGAGAGAAGENDSEAGSVTPGEIVWAVYKVWTGATSTAWSVSTNWSPANAPLSTDTIRIDDRINDPTLDVNGACKSILITNGLLTISAANILDVYGDLTVDSTGALNMTAGTVSIRGSADQNLNPGGTVAGDGQIANLTTNKTGGTATLTTNTTVAANLTMTAGVLNVGTVTLAVNGAVQTAGGTGTLQIGTGTLDANGSINLVGGSLTCVGASTIRASGAVTSLGTFTAGASIFIYDASVAQTVFTTGVTYYNVTFQLGGGAFATVPDGGTLNLSNDFTLATGGFDADSAPATANTAVNVARDLTLDAAAGTFAARNASFTIGRHWTRNGGTLSSGGSDSFTFNGSSQTIGGTLGAAFDNWTVSIGSNTTIADGITVQVLNTTTNDGTITFAAGSSHLLDVFTFNGAGGSLVFTTGGEMRIEGGSALGAFTAGTGKVVFDGPGAQTVDAYDYYDLTINKTTGTASGSAGNTTVAHDLTVSDGNYDIGSGTVTVAGTTTLSDPTPPGVGSISISTGVLDLNGPCAITSGATIVFSGGGRVDFGGAVAFPADPTVWLTPSTSSVRFDRTDSNYSISRNGVTGYNHLTIRSSGRTVSLPAGVGVNVGGNLAVELGALSVGSANTTVSGNVTNAGTISIGAGTLDVTTGTFDGTGGTISFSGAGLLELGGAVTDLGSLSASQGTVRYNSGGAQTVDNVAQYYHLDIPKTVGTATLGGDVAVAGNLTVSGGGTFDLSQYDATVSGAVSVNTGSTLKIGSGTLDCGGAYNATGGGTEFAGAGNLTLRGAVTSLGTFTSFSGCTVSYRSTAGGDQQIVVPAPSNYHHLVLNRGAALTSTTAGSLTLGGDLTIAAGILDAATNGITLGGSLAISDGQEVKASAGSTIDVTGSVNANATGKMTFTGTPVLKLRGAVTSLGTTASFTAGSGTVQYLGTLDQTMAAVDYQNVLIDNAGYTVTLNGTATADGTLTVAAGPPARTLALAGGSDLRVTGNVTVNASSTLTLTNACTLRVGAGSTLQVDGAFSASGTSPNFPTVTSTNPGMDRYGLVLNGTVTVDGLNVGSTNASGMVIGATATLTGNNLANVKFSYGVDPGGVWLNLQTTVGGPYSISGCDFPGTNFAQYNVRTPVAYADSQVEMLDSTGGRAGQTYEDDRTTGGSISPGSIDWIFTYTWTGAVDTAWALPGNWSPAGPPTIADNVLIPNVVNDPDLSTSASCRNLTITGGAPVEFLSGGGLSVSGNLSCGGSITMFPGTALWFVGTRNQSFSPGIAPYLNVSLNKTAGQVTLGGNLNVGAGGLEITEGTLDIASRTVTVPSGASLTFGVSGTRALTASTGTLTCNGTFNGSGGSLTWTGAGTLNFNSAVTAPDTFTMAATSLCRYQDSSTDRTLFPATYGRVQINVETRVVTLGGSSTANGLFEVLGGTFDLGVGANTLTVAGTMSVSSGATLRATGSAAPGPTLQCNGASNSTLAGTLRLDASGANYPQILFDSTGGFTVTGSFITTRTVGGVGGRIAKTPAGSGGFPFQVSGMVDVDGLAFSDADTNGLFLSQPTSWTRMKGVSFGVPAAGGTCLRIEASALAALVQDCIFPALGGGQYNVTASDSDLGGDVSITVAGATGAGEGETYDSDADADENGSPESPMGGAVVCWIVAANTDVGGDIQLFVTPAYDLFSGVWYSTYVASRLPATDDRIAVLDQYGATLYTYSIPDAAYGEVVGVPWWETNPVAPNEHLVFFGTSGGYLFALEDTGAALVAWPGWTTNPVAVGPPSRSVDSPVVGALETATNEYFLFFGGGQAGLDGIFAFSFDYDMLPTSTTEYFFVQGATAPTRSAPGLLLSGSPFSWRLFAGADQAVPGGSPGILGVVVDSSSSAPYAVKVTDNSVMAPVAVDPSGVVYVGGGGTKFYALDGASPGSLPDMNAGNGYPGYSWPYATTGAITRLADIYYSGVRFGDTAGYIYNLTADGTDQRLPLLLDGGTPIYSACYVHGNTLYVGNDSGKLFVIDLVADPMTVLYTYQLAGPTDRVFDVSVDFVGSSFFVIAGAGNGTVYYIDRTVDGGPPPPPPPPVPDPQEPAHAFTVMSGGSDVATYGTLQAALNAATATNNIVEPRGWAWTDLQGGTVTFPGVSGVVLRNGLLLNGSIQGSGAASGSKGTLRNCFVALTAAGQNIGGVAPLDSVDNCTVVDEANQGTVKITADAIRNTALSGTGDTLSGAVTTCLTGVAITDYVDSARRDFHVKSTAAHIDVGTNLGFTPAVDIDGNGRPIGAAWEVGADEYGAGTPLAVPVWSTAEVEGGRFGAFQAPADFNFWTGLLYGGTGDGGGMHNNSLLALSPTTGQVLRALDLAGLLGTTSARVVSTPVMVRTTAGPPPVDLIFVSVDTGEPAETESLGDKRLLGQDYGTGTAPLGDRIVCLRDLATASTELVDPADNGGDVLVTSTTGFPASGTAWVDGDDFTYAGLTATSFTGVAGITGTHASSAAVGALLPYVTFSGNGVIDDTDGANALHEPIGGITWALEAGVYYVYLSGAVTTSGPVRLCKFDLSGSFAAGWPNTTRALDHAPSSFYSKGLNRIYGSLTNDTSGADIATFIPGTGLVDQATLLGSATTNRRPVIWISPSAAASWALAAPQVSQIFAVDGGTGVVQWSSLDLGASPTSQVINPFGYTWAYVAAGSRICKIHRSAGTWPPDMASDWPASDWLKGPAVTNLLSFGGWMYFGTGRGYCYRVAAINDTAAGNDGKNGVVAGFPYRVPGARITGVSFSFAPKRAYYTCDDGRIVAFTIP